MALMIYMERERGLCFDFEEVMEGVRSHLEASLEGCKEVDEFKLRVGERLRARAGRKGGAQVEGAGAEAIV